MDKAQILGELAALVEEGEKAVLSTVYNDGVYETIYVCDALAFDTWHTKVRAICETSNEIKESTFYANILDSYRNTKFNCEYCISMLKSLMDFIERDIINIGSRVDEGESFDDEFPTIFISHSSSDKRYGDALREYLIDLGVDNNRIIYTSHPLNKIPLNKSIYDYLRDKLTRKFFMIILWSNEYLESPACLNEMGALWVTNSDYTNFYTPDFSFGNPKYHQCAVDTRKMGAVLNGDSNCKASMIEFKNQIVDMFGLITQEEEESFYLDKFIEKITN